MNQEYKDIELENIKKNEITNVLKNLERILQIMADHELWVTEGMSDQEKYMIYKDMTKAISYHVSNILSFLSLKDVRDMLK